MLRNEIIIKELLYYMKTQGREWYPTRELLGAVSDLKEIHLEYMNGHSLERRKSPTCPKTYYVTGEDHLEWSILKSTV